MALHTRVTHTHKCRETDARETETHRAPPRSTMKLLALLLTGAAAFAPAVKPLAARTVSQKMMPEALDVVSQMPSQLLSSRSRRPRSWPSSSAPSCPACSSLPCTSSPRRRSSARRRARLDVFSPGKNPSLPPVASSTRRAAWPPCWCVDVFSRCLAAAGARRRAAASARRGGACRGLLDRARHAVVSRFLGHQLPVDFFTGSRHLRRPSRPARRMAALTACANAACSWVSK